MYKNGGLRMKNDEVSKSLNQLHNIDLYIGVSGAGKTYQLKHKVLAVGTQVLVYVDSSDSSSYFVDIVSKYKDV